MSITEMNQVAKTLADYFNGIGLFAVVSESRKSWGNSNYVIVTHGDGNTHKVRMSDHSVMSNQRILDELHYTHETRQEIIDVIEYYSFPEKFKLVDSVHLVGDKTIATGMRKEQVERLENVKSVCEFTSKKGETLYNVEYYKTRKAIARIA